ncbi:MAG: DMT family transporter [Verrucomicrobia bacterium]|nr:DMT family transporter [Verrucomicrobiota bacterium]
MKPVERSLAAVNLAVLLWGGTALFPKLIPLPAAHIVWGRSCVAAAALALFMKWTGDPAWRCPPRHALGMTALGALLAAHWLTYFEAIQVSTVAVAVISLHVYPMITILLEPWWFRERLFPADAALGLLTLAGVAVMTPGWDLRRAETQGVLLGLVSACCWAVRNILTRSYARRYSGSAIMFFQTLGVALLLTPWTAAAWRPLDARCLSLLGLLGAGFTALPQAMYAAGMRRLKAKTVGLIGVLLPVYGSLSALFVLREVPSLRTILGGTIVVGAVAAEIRRNLDRSAR